MPLHHANFDRMSWRMRQVNKKEEERNAALQKAATTMKGWWHATQPADIRQTDETGPEKLQRKETTKNKAAATKRCHPKQQHFKHGQCSAVCAYIFLSTVSLSAPIRRENNEYKLSQTEGKVKWMREHKNEAI